MLDKKLEILGNAYAKQFDLIQGVLQSDNKKLKGMDRKIEIPDEELLNMVVSKVIKTLCLGNF